MAYVSFKQEDTNALQRWSIQGFQEKVFLSNFNVSPKKASNTVRKLSFGLHHETFVSNVFIYEVSMSPAATV